MPTHDDTTIRHPAKFSDTILDAIKPWIIGYDRILDPFAGTGKLRLIKSDAYLLEIEPEWAEISHATVGNALDMPWSDLFFDCIVTSPAYGNRMADHHNAKDGSKRITYTHVLGRKLHPDNSGQLQWGPAYRDFHTRAWMECDRVLRRGGRFILNVSDHIRDGKIVPVSDWHKLWFMIHGYRVVHEQTIQTPRLRRGANAHLRVEFENLFVMDKYA